MDTSNGNKQKPAWFSPQMVIVGVIILFVLILGSTSFVIVDQTEDAVITRFGKYYTTLGPGLHFKIPFGIDKKL